LTAWSIDNTPVLIEILVFMNANYRSLTFRPNNSLMQTLQNVRGASGFGRLITESQCGSLHHNMAWRRPPFVKGSCDYIE